MLQRTARTTFANPPVNLVIPETVVTLREIVRGLDNAPIRARGRPS